MSARFRRWKRCAVYLLLAASVAFGLVQISMASESAETNAPQLVNDALRAEVDGNVAKRRVLLSVAVDSAPDFAPARWHSGQVLAGGEWLPVKEAQAAAAANPARAQYESLRAAAEGSPEAQLALARWCRKNGLEEEARFHWTTLLTFEPNNDEALRALGVRWFGGRLLTKSEVASANEQIRIWRDKVESYAPQLTKWERLLNAGDLKSRDEALAEIRSLRDAHAIPAIEELTLNGHLKTNDKFELNQKISEAFLAALDAMSEQAATASLLRHAIFSPLKSVRQTAIGSLRKRPLHAYVPMLLAALSTPIESSFRITTGADGSVHYWHSYYRESQTAGWSTLSRRSMLQEDLQGSAFAVIVDRGEVRNLGTISDPSLPSKVAAAAVNAQSRYGSAASAEEQSVANANRAINARNLIITDALAAVTGQSLGPDPRAWWNWWGEYNEYSSDGEKSSYDYFYAENDHRYYRMPTNIGRYNSDGTRVMSCFAAGTLVWTSTGNRPIESLRIGDLVLAQNIDTGELAYKPVIGRTVRPPSAILNLRFGKESLETTLGHPLWVVGAGWQMAKELGEGELLHGVNGPVRIDGVEKRDDAEAYNLVVADFNTYFVGESGVLVHDNMLREPTTAVVPGLLATASAR